MTDQNKIKLNELLPCPFCGNKPEIIDKEVSDFTPPREPYSICFASAKGKSIACTNKDCCMRPYTHPCPEENLWMFKYNWNQRALPSDNGATDDELAEIEKVVALRKSLSPQGADYIDKALYQAWDVIIRNHHVKAGDDL